jgi:DNA-directed RNA polymerase sigma subunit (sigma70/sigma32)
MSPDPVAIEPARSSWVGPRMAGISTLVLVFLCGTAVGALAFTLGAHKRLHRDAFWSDSGKAVATERLKRELDLTPEQVGQMESVLDDFAKYYQTVLSDGKSRIMQILNEEQKKKFERMLAESKGH